MDFTHVLAGKDDNDRRIDRIVRRYLNETALSSLYKSLRSGLIKLNGKKCAPGDRVCEGDDISIAAFLCGASAPKNKSPSSEQSAAAKAITNGLFQSEDSKIIPEESIIFRNEHLLILNKPYDIPVQPSAANQKALSTLIQQDYALLKKESTSISFRPGPLHRLDRKTTGLLCASQSLQGARWFTKAMQSHTIRKQYVCLLEGRLTDRMTWTDSVKKNIPGRGTKEAGFATVTVGSQETGSKEALTTAIPLAYGSWHGKDVTLTQCTIQTGRTHQIRAQAAAHGHPLLGDTAYGGSRLTGCGQDFFLHAYELCFLEPSCGVPTVVQAPIMTFFQKMLGKTLIKWDGQLIL
ncbi:MAG: RluA family pseudouridine synthase [Treponema sp.]|nr:RluA family pseudouridine synthase [Treponema sp.]